MAGTRSRRTVGNPPARAAAFLVLAGACGCGPGSVVPLRPAAPQSPKFVESAEASGIRFRMTFLSSEHPVNFKVNLYDHGSGVAVADFDGDGADDIYFLNQFGANALYRNDGRGRFTDVTEAAGVALADRVCVSAAFGDVDGDGDADLYVTSTRGGNVLFRNDGGGRFTDVTAAAGLTLVAHSDVPAFFDCDGDGDLDLIVTNTGKWTQDTRDPGDYHFLGKSTLFEAAASPPETNCLYRNDGTGKFTDVTEEAGVGGVGWGADVAVFDYDDDGDLDLFAGSMFGYSFLYRNDGGGKFADVTRDVLGATSWGAAGAKVLDYDGDGRLDLFVTDMHSDMWMPITSSPDCIDERKKYAGVDGAAIELKMNTAAEAAEIRARLKTPPDGAVYGNTLFRNLGGGRFEEVSDKAGAETFWPWGVAPADFDLDGDEDAYIPSGMGYPYFYWRSPFLMNQGDGTFVDRCREVGLEPPPGGLMLEQRVQDRLAARSSRAAAVADFDADGRPDIVVNNMNDRAFLWMNRFPVRHWLAFRLTATRGQHEAIGATVTLRVAGKPMVRMVQAAGGYLAQSTRTLFFGLGDATKVDSCEIRWPGGHVESIAAPAIDRLHAIRESPK